MPAGGNKPYVPPGKPAVPDAPATATVASWSVLPSVWCYASGLPPGSTFWGNAYFLADGDQYPYASGQTQKVTDEGSVTFVFPLNFLTRGEEGELTCWIASAYLGEPLQGPNGPASVTVRVP